MKNTSTIRKKGIMLKTAFQTQGKKPEDKRRLLKKQSKLVGKKIKLIKLSPLNPLMITLTLSHI